MPELSETAILNHTFNVTNGALGRCDMITDRDLANGTGPETCGSDLMLKWPAKNAEMPHKPSGLGKEETHFVPDPDSLQGKTDRMSRTLDAKCSKADLHDMCQNVQTLDQSEQDKLEKVLQNSESSFDGTLGLWEGDPTNEIERKC